MADPEQILLHPATVMLVRYRALVRGAFRGVAIYGIAVGLATWLGGDRRMWGPSYKGAVDIAETVGASPSVLWGVSVAIFGLLALTPNRKVALWGLYGVAAWSGIFAIGFLVAVHEQPLAGMSGIFAHLLIALVVTGLIVVRLVDRRI